MDNGFNPTNNNQGGGQAQQFSNWLDDFQASNTVQQDYPNAPDSFEDQINAMPNSDKLSGTERWLYNKLPGFAQSKPMQALSAFLESPAGKVLNVLDFLAEGAERTLGLLAQYRDMQPGDEFRLKDAWAAGSLFWDTSRLPRVSKDEFGNFNGLQIDNDMPGTYAITEARKLLQEGKSLEEVKGLLYDNLGALALRAQLQDTMGHIVVDPLNFLLGAIKPVERLHAIRNLALTGKMDIEAMQAAEQAARLAGNVEEAATIASAITKAGEQGKALTRFERFVINLTGGTPYLEKTEAGYKMLDIATQTPMQRILAKLNPFALTPQARASELLDVIAANVGENLVRPMWNSDPEEFIKAMSGAARGAIGSEWNHLAATIQGRTTQAILSNSEAAVKVIGKEWATYKVERTLLARIAAMMPGETERSIWRMAKTNSKNLWEKVIKLAQETGEEDLLKAVQSGALNPKMFDNLGKIDNSIPLLREEFYAKTLVTIQDVAMRQSILQFGIKEKGLLTKWSDALKAWESLPFIKANPANAMRNLVNNDITLIGRGLFGTMTNKAIDDVWKGKWIPPQFQRGFGLAGNELSTTGKVLEFEEKFDPGSAIKALEKALTGKETLADKIKNAAGKVDLKAFDFSTMSAKYETQASKRASTMGWLQFHQQYWNPKTGFTSVSKYLDTNTLDEMEQVMPGISRVLDEVAQSSGADSEKFAQLMQSSIEHNISTVFKNTEDGLGFKMGDVLGTDTMHRIQEGLPDAMAKGQVREFVDGLRSEMEAHVDDMFNRHLENLPGIIAAQVQAGGPLQFHRIFGKAIDEFWSGNTEHAMRMSTINELMDYAKSTGDWNKVNSLWSKVMSDSENHFGRVWKKFDAYQEGLMQGAKNAGVPYPKEVSSSFGEIQSGWKRFFEYRNNAYRELFESGGKSGKDFDGIQKTLDAMYEGLAKQEDKLYQRIDDLMADSLPDPVLQGVYRNFRDKVSQLRSADRQYTQKFYRDLRTAAPEDAPAMWATYWKERMTRVEQIRQMEMRGSAAIQGDPNSIQQFMGGGEGQANDIFGLANQYGISSATGTGDRNNRRILNTVNKYLEEGQDKFKKVEDIPLDVAQKAFDTRRAEKAGKVSDAVDRAFIPDAERIFPDPMPIETGLSELNYGRGYAVMDALVDEAIAQSGKKSRLVSELPEHIQKKISQWTDNVNNEMSSFRSAGVQYAAFRRDSALLNYNRRTNFDNFVGHGAPFAFWTTHSVANWAIYSLDRPAMLTSYFRSRQFFETAGLSDQNVPSRLKGHIKVDLPFAPDWMGDTFVNPTRFLLPFDGFMAPWEQSVSGRFKIENKTKSTLAQMLEAGEIGEQEYKSAVETQSGDAWDRAKATAEEGGEGYDAMDFVSMTMTPHAPLMWAYNAMNGNKSDIGPFTPLSKTAKNVATMMGVEDWSNSPYNLEGRLRKSMGLSAYDKWQDYRVQREISNMAADGGYGLEEVRQAMEVAAMVEAGKLDPAEARKQSKLFKEATRRADVESGGWWAGALGGILGIPVKAYPTGEEKQRVLAEQFGAAIEANENGNPEALAKFFDDHPEYESRLALFKSPEERLKNFMIDNMWSRWSELPKLTQDEMKEQLGDNFANMFLNKETRSYETIRPEQLQIWLALTKGKQVGKLSAETEALLELNQLKLTDPEIAWRVQSFYDSRNEGFKDFYKLQNEYYSKSEGAARQKYLAENPQLREYWNFRRKWMEQNPDLVRFLTDDPKQLKKFENIRRNPQNELTVPTRQEIQANFSPEMIEIIGDWKRGQSLPSSVGYYLQYYGMQYNLSPEQIMGILTGQ